MIESALRKVRLWPIGHSRLRIRHHQVTAGKPQPWEFASDADFTVALTMYFLGYKPRKWQHLVHVGEEPLRDPRRTGD